MKKRLSICFSLIIGILCLSAPAAAQDTNAPRDAAAAFLDGWNRSDFAGMYTYLHPQSQQLYAAPVFESRYQSVKDTIALEGVEYTINDVRIQGESAVISYDVVLRSATFSSIEDPDRTMRLMNTEAGWRIAWTTMDIFAGMAGDSRLTTTSRPRTRAPIYDRNGELLAWDGGTSVAVYSSQSRMLSVDECMGLIAELNRESLTVLRTRFGNRTPENVFWLAALPSEIYETNRQRLQEICGVDSQTSVFSSGEYRRYWGGNATAHVTGYIGPIPAEEIATWESRGYGSGDLIGLIGIEQAYETTLAGQPERVLRIVEPGGTVLRELAGTAGSDPAPVTLTIDRDLQLITAQALSDAFNYASWNGGWGSPTISSGGAAVVLDVNTGGVLAMASYPMLMPDYFNPNADSVEDRATWLTQTLGDRGALRNRAISEQVSPGSVFKVISLAAILNEGMTTPDETFYCDLYWDGRPYGDTREERSDWRAAETDPVMEAAGDVTPAQALMASCNPFFWQYGATLFSEKGASVLPSYARRMGLGQTYGLNIGFPEVAGVIPIPTSAEFAINESVGQGDVAIPPIQMVVAAAAVANGGTVYKPYVVQQVGSGTVTQPQVINDLDFEPGVLETMQEGMCGVVTNEDLGTAYIRFNDSEFHIVANYTLCAKTGTAQTGLYPNAWFVAYYPAEEPEIAIVVMVEQSLEGSQVSAPIVRRILDDYLGQPRAEFPWWWEEQEYTPLNTPPGGGAG